MSTLMLVVALAALATDARSPKVAVSAEPQSAIDRVAWLHGCWQSADGPSMVEEQWMAPRGGTMLGMSRTVRGARTTTYELVVLRERDGRLAYEAHPANQASATFLSRDIAASSVVFENAMHDFPQRVGYRRTGNALAAWIEGEQNGKTRRVDFSYTRVACAQN